MTEATSDYEAALTYRRQMDQRNRSLEPLAGLATVTWHTGHVEQAQEHVATIVAQLKIHALDRTEEALMVYMSCYEILQTQQDVCATEVLAMAHAQLQVRSSKIESEAMCQQFWDTPAHQAVLAAVQEQERTGTMPQVK
jgi:hypothetical protein